MIKYLLYITAFWLAWSCGIENRPTKINLENRTGQSIQIEVYNIWSGQKDTTLTIDKTLIYNVGIDELIGVYIKGLPEIKILTHKNASIILTDTAIETDDFNKYVAQHATWINKIATGETTKMFTWPEHLQHHFLKDWKKLDQCLFSLFNQEVQDKAIKPNLNTTGALAYAGTYIILDKLVDTSNLYVAKHVEYTIKKLKALGAPKKMQDAFLQRYFQPIHYNLRNDSAINKLVELNPQAGKMLSTRLHELKTISKIQPGEIFSVITGRTTNGEDTVIKFNTPYTIIDFWATWCIPCIKQLPEMELLATQTKGQITFVSISVDKQRDYDKWKAIAEIPSDIVHVWMPDAENFREQHGITGLPRMVLLDANGKVIDPDFPHINNPLTTLWLKSMNKKKPIEL